MIEYTAQTTLLENTPTVFIGFFMVFILGGSSDITPLVYLSKTKCGPDVSILAGPLSKAEWL